MTDTAWQHMLCLCLASCCKNLTASSCRKSSRVTKSQYANHSKTLIDWVTNPITVPHIIPFYRRTSCSEGCWYLETVGCQILVHPHVTYRGSQTQWWGLHDVHQVFDTTAHVCSRWSALDYSNISSQSSTCNYRERLVEFYWGKA